MKRLVLLLLLAAPAWADTVILNDGRRIEGEVSDRDGKIVVKKKNGIQIELDKAEISKIEVGPGLSDELAKKKAALAANDIDGRYALAQWCKEKGFSTDAKALLEEILKLDPDHAQARRDLGYVQFEGYWITEDALRKKMGFEKVNGKWIPGTEAKRLRRQEEIRKLLVRFALVWSHDDKKAQAAKAELDALAKEDASLVAPLVEERLGEHDASVRFALVELLGKLKAASSAPRLVTLTFEDADQDVRLAAARAAWATGDVAARTKIVQSLYAAKATIRDRAAEALGAVKDPETVPYLIEALYLVTVRTVEVETEPTITRGYGSVRAEGVFGGYWIQAGEVQLEQRYVFLYSKKVLSALKKITGKDFDYSKHDWFEWWEKEHKKAPENAK